MSCRKFIWVNWNKTTIIESCQLFSWRLIVIRKVSPCRRKKSNLFMLAWKVLSKRSRARSLLKFIRGLRTIHQIIKLSVYSLTVLSKEFYLLNHIYCWICIFKVNTQDCMKVALTLGPLYWQTSVPLLPSTFHIVPQACCAYVNTKQNRFM